MSWRGGAQPGREADPVGAGAQGGKEAVELCRGESKIWSRFNTDEEQMTNNNINHKRETERQKNQS